MWQANDGDAARAHDGTPAPRRKAAPRPPRAQAQSGPERPAEGPARPEPRGEPRPEAGDGALAEARRRRDAVDVEYLGGSNVYGLIRARTKRFFF